MTRVLNDDIVEVEEEEDAYVCSCARLETGRLTLNDSVILTVTVCPPALKRPQSLQFEDKRKAHGSFLKMRSIAQGQTYSRVESVRGKLGRQFGET